MNKQEAIETIEKMAEYSVHELIPKTPVLEIIKQVDEPQKPRVPQVAVKFYERYKDDDLDLGEWFGDFYSPEAIEGFPRMDELAEWLHDNDDEINRQREFALATLVTFGVDAVEVEKEKLYTVEIPDPHGSYDHTVLYRKGDVVAIDRLNANPRNNWKKSERYQLTEKEIKQNHDWAWRWAKPVEEE